MPLQTGVEILLGPIISRKSRNAVINFGLYPADLTGKNSGTTETVRVYRQGTEVNLIAPLMFEGRKFLFWEVIKSNGSVELNEERSIFITINQNVVAKCIYESSELRTNVYFVIGQIAEKIYANTTLETNIEVEIL